MWSIKKALLLTFLVVVAVPLMLFWTWPQSRTLQNEVRHVREKHLLIARNLAGSLERYGRDLESSFEYLAGAMLVGADIAAPKDLLTSLRLRHLWLIDIETGKIIRSEGAKQPPASGQISRDDVKRLVALSDQRGSRLGGVMTAPDGLPVMPMVRIASGRLVLGSVDTSYFVDVAASVRFGKAGHATIVDHEGRVLAHPVKDWERDAKDISNLAIVSRALTGASDVGTFISPMLREEMIAGFANVPGVGWGVIVAQPFSELQALASAASRYAFSIFALGLLLAAVVALRFSWLVIEPLSRVMRAAERMAGGENGVQIDLPGKLVPHELSTLAGTFNAMADSVTRARECEVEARARAEDANKQKTEFVRYITHELRSPINAILGYSERLASETSTMRAEHPEMLDDLLHIRESGRHLLSLVNDLLDLGKIESGHYQLEKVALGVDEIVERCLRTTLDAADARGVTVRSVYDGDPPEILADERAMYQVLLNLVTNAVRYGREGGSVTVATETRADGAVEICVVDDGPGIAQDDLERVMLPFQRAEHSGAVQGTGLGLPIVKRLVEMHGGRFTLASTVGVGTAALIELPPSASPSPARLPRDAMLAA